MNSMANLTQEILTLTRKEFILEWRDRSVLQGLLLYIAGTVFVCYMSFGQRQLAQSPITWNTLFWIIQLFAAMSGLSRSFAQEGRGRQFLYYTLVSPQGLILSKICYNILLLLCISLSGFAIYSLLMGNPVQDLPLYLLALLLGATGFSSTLTMVAGIAAKSNNNATLMAVLGFPIILPMISMLVKVSKNAMDGLARSASQEEILTILALDAIVVALSVLLFPYLWRS